MAVRAFVSTSNAAAGGNAAHLAPLLTLLLSSPPSLPPFSHGFAVCRAGSFDRFLNLQIGLVILMQLAMCLFCAIANYIFIQHSGKDHYYLVLDVYTEGNWSSWVAQICLTFLTFWILLSYLVPISLFVTLEIVKFWQVRSLACCAGGVGRGGGSGAAARKPVGAGCRRGAACPSLPCGQLAT